MSPFTEQEATEAENRLVEALNQEAAEVCPSARAWEAIASRTAGADPFVQRRRRQHAARATAAAVGAALVAATLVVVAGNVRHEDSAPAVTPTAPSSMATTGTTFDPSTPRTTWTIFRAGSSQLYADEVRASAPYDPAQAFTALFATKAAFAGPVGVEADGKNVVASVAATSSEIVLDLSAADATRPTGSDPERTAKLWVQAWVHTAQAAYGSDLPLRITLDGRPTRLFGLVDTADPFDSTDVSVVRPERVYLPTVGERVTSPVDVVVDPGPGAYDVIIRDETTGKTVVTQGSDVDVDTVRGFGFDLPPGPYELVVKPSEQHIPAGSTRTRNLFQSDFVVTGPAPAPTQTPVTDPPTTPVALVPVTFPSLTGTTLVQEWRPRSSIEAAVRYLTTGPTNDETDVVVPWRGATVRSVTRAADLVTIDLTGLDNPVAPDAATARRWAGTLTRAVQRFYDDDSLRVQVLLDGTRTQLFGQLDGTKPLEPPEAVTIHRSVGLFSPADGSWAMGGAVLVGATEPDTTSMTWYVRDAVSNATLYQGTAALDAAHTYGFSLPLAPGSYLLEIALHGGERPLGTVYDLTVR